MGNDNFKPEMNSRQVQSKDSFLVQSAGLAVFRLVKDDTNADAEQRVEWLLLQDNPRLIPNFTFICLSFFIHFSSISYSRSHHWTPPKGHIDPGESAMEAALRETKEESGLDAAMLTVYHEISTQINYVRKKKPKVVTYWLAKLENPDQAVTISDEHQSFEWLGLTEAKDLAPRHAPVFDKFNEDLKNILQKRPLKP